MDPQPLPQQPSTTPEALPVNQPLQPSRKPPVTIILFSVVILCFLGFLLYQNTKLQQQVAALRVTPTIYISPTPSVSPEDPTTDWKTYTNTTVGIQFNHPNDWTIRGFAGDQENYENSVSSYTRFIMEDPSMNVSLIVANNEYGPTTDPCLEESSKVETVRIDGVSFTKTEYSGICPENDSVMYKYASEMKKLSFSFSFPSTSIKSSEILINNLISSFKFLESLSAAPKSSITEWKTFTGNTFSFEYPSIWKTDEKCTKLGFPSNDTCLYSQDFQRVTRKVTPGDGGSDTIVEYNIGNLILIGRSGISDFSLKGYCSPGGPSTIENCHEKKYGDSMYAIRESGSYPYSTNMIEALLLNNKTAVANLSFFFSKKSKLSDMGIFERILSSFKYTPQLN